MLMKDYASFIEQKSRRTAGDGFEPVWMPDFLFDFQKCLTTWALKMGRAALLEDCGLGKGVQELVWAENVVRYTNRPVLLLAPLAVAHQFARESEKFGIDIQISSDGKVRPGARIVVTNYQKLHHFDSSDFAGIACDESGILKNTDGAYRKAITRFMRTLRYRLLATATAAPNDYHELGTHSDALGFLGARDMLTRFFKEDVVKDYLGWGRKSYRFRGHAEEPFWRWVASWARACRRPSDLGFNDRDFVLPPLHEHEVVIEDSTPRPGMLFSTPASGLREQREERRVTLKERCSKAAELSTGHDGATVLWCHLNDEGDLIEKMIPECVQVKGAMSDEEKQEKLTAFQDGEIKRLVTKPKIGCYGLNWQHCNNVVTFVSNSWEQYYQLVRRCWRFGQERPVHVHVISTQGEQGVIDNLKRKANQSDRMFTALVSHMNDAIQIERDIEMKEKEKVPTWL